MEALRASLGKRGGKAKAPPRPRRPRPRPRRRRPRAAKERKGVKRARGAARSSSAGRAGARAREEVTRATMRGRRRPYTLRSIQEMLGLSRGVISGLIAAGFVTPTPRPAQRVPLHLPGRGAAAHRRTSCRRRSIPPRRILRSLRAAEGDAAGRAAAHRPAHHARSATTSRCATAAAQWQAESGQLLMDFEVAPAAGSVTFLQRSAGGRAGVAARRRRRPTPARLVRRGEALEAERPARRRGGLPAARWRCARPCRRLPQPRRAAVRSRPLRRGGRAVRRGAARAARTRRCCTSTARVALEDQGRPTRRSPLRTPACSSRPTSPTRTTTRRGCTSSSATSAARCATSAPTGGCSARVVRPHRAGFARRGRRGRARGCRSWWSSRRLGPALLHRADVGRRRRCGATWRLDDKLSGEGGSCG